MTVGDRWKKIAELVADGSILAIQDGNHGGSHPKASEYVPEGIPFIMASDVDGGRITLDQCKRLPKERTDRLRIGFAKTGDVLLTHKGTVGEVAIVPEVDGYVMLTPQVTYYRVDRSKLDPRYLALTFRGPEFQSQLSSISAQSTRPYVAISTQRHLMIPWVPLETQRRIAAILGAYDDLIEVNRRRVAVLEEMTRGLYDEWFVRFRFPGHETVPVVETPDGPLPSGWRLSTLGKEFNVVLGGTPARNRPQLWGGTIPWLNSGKANDLRVTSPSEFITEEGLARSSTKLMPGGATIIAITGATLGQVSILAEPMCGNQSLVGLWDESGDRDEYAYRYIRSRIEEMIARASGGAQQHINKQIVDRFPYREPPLTHLKSYLAVAKPAGAMISNLLNSNSKIAASRDLLLPRLISGQLSVANAERELEAAA